MLEKNDTKPTTKKRGRKTKKEISEANNSSENIVVSIEETTTPAPQTDTGLIDHIIHVENQLDNDVELELEVETDVDNKFQSTTSIESVAICASIDAPANVPANANDEKPAPKKRGRKPKGGKIVQQVVSLNNAREIKPNIILHLKCSLKDLQSNNLFGSSLEGFTFSNNTLNFDKIVNENAIEINSVSAKEYEYNNNCTDYECDSNKDNNDIREIWKKLKVLEHNLHINSVENKKSACFWDSCEFDNPQIYIPKYYMNGTYHVYGCFCSPECAVAYLMEENIDSSIKFERYQLINHIYCKVYNYSKNIKPAPNPYYMLEKYYGNLSIQEYRSLLKNERLFLVVDKPLTRVMPELHEDNDDFIINNKIIPSNTYQVKKRLQKKQTKVNILGERFGLVQS
jgi:hypothetical protein